MGEVYLKIQVYLRNGTNQVEGDKVAAAATVIASVTTTTVWRHSPPIDEKLLFKNYLL